MSTEITDILVTVLVAVLSSSGLWAYLEKRKSKLVEALEKEEKSDCNMKELLIALAKVQICHMATIYIERGWISTNEAEMLEQTFKPYHEIGGNGAGEILYKQAMNLPRHKSE